MSRPGQPPGMFYGNAGLTSVLVPTNLVDYWDSAYGVTLVGGAADTWASMRRGYTVARTATDASSRPVYGADGTNFNSMPVIQCSTAGKAMLTGGDDTTNFPAALALSGTRPYIFHVLRNRDNAHIRLAEWQKPGASTFEMVLYDLVGFTFIGSSTASPDTTASDDTTPHLIECWNDATTGAHLVVDGTDTNLAGQTSAIANDIKRLSVGQISSNHNQVTNSSHALMGICTAVPSAGERTALRAYCQKRWGTP
jgi:hypothetical protein